MILLTFDDSINTESWAVMKEILDAGLKNPNGCNIRTTWFTSWDATSCPSVFEYVSRGQELADHTVSHKGYAPIDEISRARRLCVQCTSLDESEIFGFRPPLFQHAPWTLDALSVLNFSYLSTNTDSYTNFGSAEKLGNKFWPYTLDYGMQGECTAHCDYSARNPGLWSISMNSLDEYRSGANLGMPLQLMDPDLSVTELQNLYWNNLLLHYNGNRSPFGIWLHPSWFKGKPERITWLIQFLTAALSLPDVWVVSGQDVISYMKHPIASGTTNVPFVCPQTSSSPPPMNLPRPSAATPPLPPPPMQQPLPEPQTTEAPLSQPNEPSIPPLVSHSSHGEALSIAILWVLYQLLMF